MSQKLSFDKEVTHSWAKTLAEVRKAVSETNNVQILHFMRILSAPFWGKYISQGERVRRMEIYRKICSDECNSEVKSRVPEWYSVFEQWDNPELNRDLIEHFKNRPFKFDAGELYAWGVDLLVDMKDDDDDIQKEDLEDRFYSWRYPLITSMESEFIPGDERVLLITSTELATLPILDSSTTDGNNIFGTAAESWLPMKITHHLETEGRFFFFEDGTEFVNKMSNTIRLVREGDCSVITVATGFEDIRAGIVMGISANDMAVTIIDRLRFLVEQTGVPVVFGGLLELGCLETRRMVKAVHLILFKRALDLKKFAITLYECSSPSPSASLNEVYDNQGLYTCRFRAVVLHALSRATALNFDNMIWPNPLVKASQQDADFAVFVSRYRVGLC